MDKISVIIPVYNSEPYIKKCLESIINQTYINLEILCIDDGSYDKSVEICEEYAKKDNRIKILKKEFKGGSGTPVDSLNKGLKEFTGKYVGFVDPDDWLEPEMYEVLYKALKIENVPISIVSYFKDTNTETVPMINKKIIPCGVISTENMLLYALKRDYYMGFLSYLWNKLFSAEVIRTSGVYLDKNIKYGYDTLVYYTLILSGNYTGVYIDKPLYHYFQRCTSISNTRSVYVRNGILTTYKRIEDLMSKKGYFDLTFWARGFYCHHASVIAEIALETNDAETFSKMREEIKNNLEDYFKTNKEFPEKFERIERLLKINI